MPGDASKGERFGARVDRAAEGLGVALEPGSRAALLGWLELVVLWNAKVDLTAARGDDELVDLMMADALVLSRELAPGARVVDVGSGAGAPGLPLALLRQDLFVTLCEPLQKRAGFLRTVIGALGLARRVPAPVELRRARGEDLVLGAAFDVAISRATLPPPAWLELGARLAPEVWVLLAREEAPEAEGLRLERDLRYRWPLSGADRRAARFLRGA